MKSLWRKEVLYLMPTLAFFLFFTGADLIFLPLVDRIDEIQWVRVQNELLPGQSSGILWYLFGLVVAYSLFPREYEEATIHYLHTLPVSRRGIFGATFLAGVTVLAITSVHQQGIYFLLQLFENSSISGDQFRLSIALSAGAINLVVGVTGLAHGLLLSFGRHYGVVVLMVAGYCLAVYEEHFPWLVRLDPSRLADFEYAGQQLLIPWFQLGFHLVVATFCLGLAHFLWSQRGEELTYLHLKATSSWAGRLSLGCATTVALILLLIIIAQSDGPEETSGESSKEVSYQTARLRSKHYIFTYPVNLRHQAVALVEEADPLFLEVSERFEVEPGSPVVVDLTDVSRSHYGVTQAEKIKIDLTASEQLDFHLHTLAHETTHVMAARLASRRLYNNQRTTYFFNEGVAQYVGFETVNRPIPRRQARRQARLSAERSKA